jgi:hypothetical protein
MDEYRGFRKARAHLDEVEMGSGNHAVGLNAVSALLVALIAASRLLHTEGLLPVMTRPTSLAIVHVRHLEGTPLPLGHLEDLGVAIGALQILGDVLFMAEDDLALSAIGEFKVLRAFSLSPRLLHHDRAQEGNQPNHNRECQG